MRKNLHSSTNITFYRTKEKVLLPYFSRENNLVFYNDADGLLLEMKLEEYNPQERRLFINSSVRNLKCFLLHNGNKCASILI